MRVRWAVIALALVALGCGKDGEKQTGTVQGDSVATAPENDLTISPDTTLGGP